METLGVDQSTKVTRLGAKENDGYDASRDLASPCSGDGSHGEVEVEETDGSSSRENSTTSLSLFMNEANSRSSDVEAGERTCRSSEV